MEKMNDFEKAKKFSNDMAIMKEERRKEILEKAKQLWVAGKEDRAIEQLMGWGSILNEDDAREYCRSKFGASVSTKQAEPTRTIEKVKTTLTPEQAIENSKKLIERIRSRTQSVAKAKTETVAAEAKVEDPVAFFKENADDTDACVAKLREMGF
jgi:hypothetical protein